MQLDPEEIDSIKDPEERSKFLAWMKKLTNYALKSFGMANPESETPLVEPPKTPVSDTPKDPVGDVIIQGLKNAQGHASIRRRKKSGWVSCGLARDVDDRHI